MVNSEVAANYLIQNLVPSIFQPPGTLEAVVFIEKASDPLPASDRAKDPSLVRHDHNSKHTNRIYGQLRQPVLLLLFRAKLTQRGIQQSVLSTES